jgi:hypothetical protein
MCSLWVVFWPYLEIYEIQKFPPPLHTPTPCMMVQAFSRGECRRIKLEVVHSQCTRLYLKNKLKKAKERGMTQAAQNSTSKHETLSSIPSIA